MFSKFFNYFYYIHINSLASIACSKDILSDFLFNEVFINPSLSFLGFLTFLYFNSEHLFLNLPNYRIFHI